MKSKTLKSSFLLFLAALIWGVAFVAQSVGMDYMGPFSFCGGRFLMGSAVLLPIVIVRRVQDQKKQIERAGYKITVLGGISCGLALCFATIFQQIGIQYTTVGKAGFITTLYIIMVPIAGLFMRKKVPGKVWIGAVIAAFGMYLLCMSEKLALSVGDTYVFICAILFTVHILVIDYFSPKADGIELSCIQFLTAGVISSIGALIWEQPTIGNFMAGIIPLLYAGILSSGVAYTLQVIGQKDMDPTVASLILSLESVISMLAGWVILGQSLTGRELCGCLLVFAAVILVQLPDFKRKAE